MTCAVAEASFSRKLPEVHMIFMACGCKRAQNGNAAVAREREQEGESVFLANTNQN